MADFSKAYLATMAFEDARSSGAVTSEPDGARARFGINSLAHPYLPETFWTGPADEAKEIAAQIEKNGYWSPLRLDEVVDQNIANKLFDMAVNMGVGEATTLAQRAVNNVPSYQPHFLLQVDGVFGSKTLRTINALAPDQLLTALRDASAAFYRQLVLTHPDRAPWLNGYLKRAEA